MSNGKRKSSIHKLTAQQIINPLSPIIILMWIAQTYYYPASTVKLPVAHSRLQKLNELNNPALDKNTTMITGPVLKNRLQFITMQLLKTDVPQLRTT